MKEQLLNESLKFLLSILTILGGYVTTLLAAYIKTKKEEAIKRIGVNQYKFYYTLAEHVFNEIEQLAQNNNWSSDIKKTEFYNRIKSCCPELTEDEIDHFREAACGENNSNVKKIIDASKVDS